MARAPKRRFSTSAIMKIAVPAGLLVLVQIGFFVRDHHSPADFAVIGWTTGGVLLLVVLLIGFFNARNGLRKGALIRANPHDFIAQLVISPPQAAQVNLLGERLTGRRKVVGENAYGTVVADESAITLYGGSFSPREWLAIPTERLVSVAVGEVLAGVRIIGSLDLEFAMDGGSRAALSLHLYQPASGFRLPRLVQGELLAQAIEEFRAATGGPARADGADARPR